MDVSDRFFGEKTGEEGVEGNRRAGGQWLWWPAQSG